MENQSLRTCDIDCEIRETGAIMLPLGDGISLHAKYTPSFYSNLDYLSLLPDHGTVTFSSDISFTGFMINDSRNTALFQQPTAKDGLSPLPNSVPPLRAQATFPARGDAAKEWHEN